MILPSACGLTRLRCRVGRSTEVGGVNGRPSRSGGLGRLGGLLLGLVGGLLGRRMAHRESRAAALGPAWRAPRGFRRSSRRAERAQQPRKPAPYPMGRQSRLGSGSLPRQPLVCHDLAGQAQLGIAGQHQPGPPVGLLRVAGPRGGPGRTGGRTPARHGPDPAASPPGRPTTATAPWAAACGPGPARLGRG